jgi:hypothetical protein
MSRGVLGRCGWSGSWSIRWLIRIWASKVDVSLHTVGKFEVSLWFGMACLKKLLTPLRAILGTIADGSCVSGRGGCECEGTGSVHAWRLRYAGTKVECSPMKSDPE